MTSFTLADWVEIPNLRTKANQAIWAVVGRVCAGIETPQPNLPRRRLGLFAFYAVASYLYRWVVLVSIVFFLYTFLRPYKLAIISIFLGLAACFVMFVLPLAKGVGMLWKRRSRLEPDYRRTAITAAVLGLLAVVIFLVPFPYRVGSPLTLRPADAEVVYVITPGVLADLHVADKDPSCLSSIFIFARTEDLL